MKRKILSILVGGFLSASLLVAGTAFAGGVEVGSLFSATPKVVLMGAATFMDRTGITGGRYHLFIDPGHVLGSLNSGLNNESNETSFAAGVAAWLPVAMLSQYGSQFNGVFFFNFIPGQNVSATGPISGAGSNSFKADVKSSRYNWGVGINVIRNLQSHFFLMGMIGGGITCYSAKADFTSTALGTPGVGFADHPGATSYEPFVKFMVGIGTELSEKSQLLVFGSYSLSRTDNNFALSNGDPHGSATVNLKVPDDWFLAGIKLTRSIAL